MSLVKSPRLLTTLSADSYMYKDLYYKANSLEDEFCRTFVNTVASSNADTKSRVQTASADLMSKYCLYRE